MGKEAEGKFDSGDQGEKEMHGLSHSRKERFFRFLNAFANICRHPKRLPCGRRTMEIIPFLCGTFPFHIPRRDNEMLLHQGYSVSSFLLGRKGLLCGRTSNCVSYLKSEGVQPRSWSSTSIQATPRMLLCVRVYIP